MMITPKQQGPALGDKLQTTITTFKKALIKTLQDQANADLARVQKEFDKRSKFVKKIRNSIMSQIESGKVPYVKITLHNDKEWILLAEKGAAPHQELWASLIREFGQEKLRLVVSEEHDGMGMEDWVVVTAVPSKNKIVYRGDGTIQPNSDELDARPVVDKRMRGLANTRGEIRDVLDLS